MSRRNKDFVHRTTVFEGAFRAWSYLGSLDPALVESNPDELNPVGADEYPYEPLPRSGLSHPFVKVVLSPWLGPHATQETLAFGLETLRIWWSHRRRGQSKTAIKVVNNKNMALVDQYTRLFFGIAHCLVFTDKEQPPKTLRMKMMKLPGANSRTSTGERNSSPSKLNIRSKCIPGNLDLPSVVGSVRAAHAAHYGGLNTEENVLGDPTSTPIVFISKDDDYQIVLEVDGITCAHCLQIVETVLLGCRGGESPISGLLDVAADQELSQVIIKIVSPTEALRIAHEASRNLGFVGYTARPKCVPLTSSADQQRMARSFSLFAKAYPTTFFNWNVGCTCPDRGIFRENCARHAQMNKQLGETFAIYEQKLREYARSKQPHPVPQDDSDGDVHLLAPDDEDIDPIPYQHEYRQPQPVDMPMEAYGGAASDFSALGIGMDGGGYRRRSLNSILRTFDDDNAMFPGDGDIADSVLNQFYV